MSTTISFEATGTHWQIDIDETISAEKTEVLKQTIVARLNAFEKKYSRFRTDSWLTSLNQHSGLFTLPDDAKPLFDLYYEIYQHTDGAVTPLIGSVLSQAGYDANYSFKAKKIQKPDDLFTVTKYQYPHLLLQKPLQFDLGAAGKGYAIDIVAALIRGR